MKIIEESTNIVERTKKFDVATPRSSKKEITIQLVI